MEILIFALILILVVGLAVYLVDLFPLDSRLALAAKAILILIAIILLIQRAGLV